MDSDSTKGIIELGSLNIKCLIVKINSDNTMSVLQLRKNELSDEEVVEVSEELYSTFTRITGRIR